MRQIITKNRSEPAILHQRNVGLKRTDNQFMKYLFTVADTSEPIDITWLGTRHMVYPVRDLENVAFGVIDLYMRPDDARENSSEWFSRNTAHLNTMFSILNLVYRQLVIKTGLESTDRLVLQELESNVPDRLDIHEAANTEAQVRTDTIFEDLMLAELNQVQRLLTDEASRSII
ncbi:hypothetical protein FBUS_08131 [Fasciolopsis buskii]|uniref:Uncharacterized protein n=1 Tax=Fasciolopsis buskii TaxID=27845 RepID=A0A8E0RML7_9TREM|nr:hypothetical protein FBUS_08131 [Fasciolopsis buski]